jgi:hypothetical protein
MLVFLVAPLLLLLLLLVILFFPSLMRAISNIVIIFTTIVASPLGFSLKLVFLVSFEELLLIHHFGESSYKESYLSGIIRGALIITIIIIFFFA